MLSEEVKKLANVINESSNILLVIHRHPDGDAIGSILSMTNYLLELNKQVVCFCIDAPSENFYYLENIKDIKNNIEIIEKNNFDLCITLDCADMSMTKISEILKNKNFKFGLVNIDHHVTNNKFGNINIVIDKASSTSEVIYIIFKTLNIKINLSVATCLLTGILTDTNNFTNGGTTIKSIESASELLKIGANIKDIINANFFNKSVKTLNLWGEALKRITYDEKLQIVVTAIFDDDIKNFNLTDVDATEGISNYLNNLSKEIKCSLVLKDNGNGKIRGSLRTTRDDIDVSNIALAFGGGGHKKAAGFEVDGKLVFNNNMWQIIKFSISNDEFRINSRIN